MATKFLASYGGSNSAEKIATVKQTIADALGVCPEDVIILPGVSSLSAVEVPDAMCAARKKADAQAAKAAEAEKVEAEKAAAASEVPPEHHETHHKGHKK